MSKESQDVQLNAFNIGKKLERYPLKSKNNTIFDRTKSNNKERTKIWNSLKRQKQSKSGKKQRWSIDEKDNPQSPPNNKQLKKKQTQHIQKESFRFIKRQFFTPNLNYKLKMKQSSKNYLITPIMRLILVDWLMQLSSQLSISKQACHSSIFYLDSLLSKISINKNQLQIYGLTCLMIAQKLDSQHCLTPLKAQELMLGMVDQKQFIELQREIIKVLGFKLHPYTLWGQANLIIIAAVSYFKQSIHKNWENIKRKLLWIVQGLTLQLSYFGKENTRNKQLTLRDRDLAFSLFFAVTSADNLPIKPSLTNFYTILKGNDAQVSPIYPYSLKRWLQNNCKCSSLTSYHPQLRQYAASSIWSTE